MTPVVVSATEAQLALSALEPVMEEAPLAIQEAPLEVLEAQSPTLMIQNILGELDPTGETMNAPGAIEGKEEGSRSTPEKEDAEDRKAVSVVRIFDSLAKQSEVIAATDAPLELAEAVPHGESLVVIEESAPERDAGDPKAFRLGEEVQAIPPLGTSDRAPAFVQTLNDSSPYYERLTKKRSFPSTTAPLTCVGIFRPYPR